MSNKRIAILELFALENVNGKLLMHSKYPRRTASVAINRIKELGRDCRHPGRRRNYTISSSSNRRLIKKGVQQNSRVTMWKFTREIGISYRSVRQMGKKRSPILSRKSSKMFNSSREKARTTSKKSLAQASSRSWAMGAQLLTDEKLFTVDQVDKRQNDIAWSTEAPVMPW